jgi:hypothetical protein
MFRATRLLTYMENVNATPIRKKVSPPVGWVRRNMIPKPSNDVVGRNLRPTCNSQPPNAMASCIINDWNLVLAAQSDILKATLNANYEGASNIPI